MPIKTSSGKWKWGNVERDSKKELVQTVYGIWKKNGSKGSFSDFLKGTHESIEESKIVEDVLFFHGTGHRRERLAKPETFKPFFVSKDIRYALSYAKDKRTSSLDSACVYLVKLNQTAKVFDPTNDEDLQRLEDLKFWSDGVIARLKSGADVLMVMNWAASQTTQRQDDSEMSRILHGTGAMTYRDTLCKQLKQLGYSMFKTSEDTGDGYSSDLIYGVFDVDGLESLIPTPISIDEAKKVERMIRQHRPIESILREIER